LMAKYGVNVPPGTPVFKAEDVKAAAEKMASPDGEVRAAQLLQLTRVLVMGLSQPFSGALKCSVCR